MKPIVGYVAVGAILVVVGVLTLVAVLRSDSEGPETFEGVHSFGFETSSFVPCATDDHGPQRYWLEVAPGIDFRGELRRAGLGAEVDAGIRGHGTASLRFEGELETGDPRGYGHLGAYHGELTVTRLLEVSRSGECG